MYEANRRALMTGELFTQYVRDLDEKIALLIDNCPAHSHIDRLTNITLYFCPQIQPLEHNLWMQK